MVKVKKRYFKNNFTGSRSGNNLACENIRFSSLFAESVEKRMFSKARNNSLEILFPTQTLLMKKNLVMKYKIESSMRA